jgi:HK97 family phage major capsid protein/HK97 family phage prohead protease
MHRMYSLLTVKAVEDEKRIIRGTATTPQPDRIGDIVEPLGVKFKNPLPLLHQHRSDQPVGTVRFDKPTKDGITFEARLPQIEEPGPLKDRVDTAWGEIKAGLVRAVSIGFRSLEHAVMETGGLRFIASEVLELSLVTIPAQAGATITEIRSIDSALLAASGRGQAGDQRDSAGVAASRNTKSKGTAMKTIAEQIASFEAARVAKAARMDEILDASAEKGETLDAEQKEEYDTLSDEVKALDEHLGRLRDREKRTSQTAKPVERVEREADGSAARSGAHVQVKAQPKLDKGIAFTRLAKVKAISRLDGESPREVAKRLYGEESETHGFFTKTTVVAGSTASGNWADGLVGTETSAFADFIEYLRPMTILGKFGVGGVPNLTRVPFRTALVGQTGGGQAWWVGEGAPKPLTAFDFSRTTLTPLKVATITVVTEELLRDSSPAAEPILRNSLAAAVAERTDIDFIDPDKTASAGVSPASVTNGVTPITSTGNDADAIREDIRQVFATFIADNNAPTTGVWIMSATTALAVGMLMNPLGQQEFPGITMNGGTLFGLPVITSEYFTAETAGGFVALVNARDIYFADDGEVMVDMSREASLQMLDNPTNSSATGTATAMVSMFQTNSVALRAERTLNWAKRRAGAVALLDGVNWGLPGS